VDSHSSFDSLIADFLEHPAHAPIAIVIADRLQKAQGIPGVEGAYAAARQADAIRAKKIDRGESFIFETVLSDPDGRKLSEIQTWRQRGYRVLLIFVGIDSFHLSTARVAQRVLQGGHDVPDDKLVERFPRTLVNLRHALTWVDMAVLLDNQSSATPYRLVAVTRHGQLKYQATEMPLWASGALVSAAI
jgi:predicted ABC-type ATPase